MNAYETLGVIILSTIIVGILIALSVVACRWIFDSVKKGKCQPKDYYRGRKK